MKKRILLAFALSAAVAVTTPLPLSAEDAGTQPDNTKMNKEMRHEGTADQQAENPADRKITQKIRKAVVKDKSLSKTAHNAKIITRDGMVSLKGTVKSDQEKQKIEEIATKVAGQGKVTNELMVAPAK